MSRILDEAGLDLLFRDARSFNAWQDRPLSRDTLAALYDLLKWGPTSFNCLPARFIFVQSAAAKQRLKPFLPLYQGRPANLAGYFKRGEDENLIVLALPSDAEGGGDMTVIFHESFNITHYFATLMPASAAFLIDSASSKTLR